MPRTGFTNAAALIICSLLVTLSVTAQTVSSSVAGGGRAAENPLSLERIFFKPYLAGTRPGDPRLSSDGRSFLFRWDEKAENKTRYWMMNTDSTGLHQVPDTILGEVEWSPVESHTIACTRKGDIFITDTGFQSFRRLTKTNAYESGLEWSPDGTLLSFSADNSIWCVPAAGAFTLYEVARAEGKDAGINLIDFMPDGKRVVFAEFSREGLPEFIVPRYTPKDVTTSSFKSGMGKTRIAIAPIDTGKTIWLKLPGDDRYYLGDVAVAPDGHALLVDRVDAGRKKREFFIADTDTGGATLIYQEEENAWIEGPFMFTRWSVDGKALLTTSERDGWNHLYSISPDGKNIEQLTKGEWEIRWYETSPAGNNIFFLANKDDHQQWQLFSLDVGTKAISRLSSQEGTYENPTLAKDGSFILAKHSDFGKPSDIVRVPTTPLPAYAAIASTDSAPATGSGRRAEMQLTETVPAEFQQRAWVKPEIVKFKSTDGKMIPAMIYKPQRFNAAKKYPVVVFVHGAGYLQNVYRGWSYYYRESMFHQRLTELGYVVFEVEYRGSAGLGRDFRTDVYMHLGGKDLQDELDGIDYLNSLGYIDPARVGIYGGSYGGFMALMGLSLSDKYACGAALRAVTSWENYYHHNAWYTAARLGTPEENPEAYKKSSPITFADSLKKPLLILHGMLDDNVFFQDAVQLVQKLQKARNTQFEVMVYPEEAHSFGEPESWYDEYRRIEEFFGKHLRP